MRRKISPAEERAYRELARAAKRLRAAQKLANRQRRRKRQAVSNGH